MAIIGWLFCVCLAIMFSFIAFIVLFNSAGKYTIGGAINSISTRVASFTFIVAVGFGWYFVFENAPFKIVALG